jgi:hypothetical protein
LPDRLGEKMILGPVTRWQELLAVSLDCKSGGQIQRLLCSSPEARRE